MMPEPGWMDGCCAPGPALPYGPVGEKVLPMRPLAVIFALFQAAAESTAAPGPRRTISSGPRWRSRPAASASSCPRCREFRPLAPQTLEPLNPRIL